MAHHLFKSYTAVIAVFFILYFVILLTMILFFEVVNVTHCFDMRHDYLKKQVRVL